MGISTIGGGIVVVDLKNKKVQLGDPSQKIYYKTPTDNINNLFDQVIHKFDNPDITTSYIELGNNMGITTVGSRISIVDEANNRVILLVPSDNTYYNWEDLSKLKVDDMKASDFYYKQSINKKPKSNTNDICRDKAIKLENGMYISTTGSRVAFVDNNQHRVQLFVPMEGVYEGGSPDIGGMAEGYWWTTIGPNIGLWSNWY